MKAKSQHRSIRAFNSVDTATGYAVRYELSKSGFWWVSPFTAAAFSGGRTIGKARKKSAEAIQLWLEYQAEMGWSTPAPEHQPSIKV